MNVNIRGFTLIELVAGIVITGISLGMLTTLIYPLFSRSVDPMFQIRAAEFAQAIVDDALSKPYDDSTPVGGQPPCSGATCNAVGAESGETTREHIDDFDDFNMFCGGAGLEDVMGVPLGSYTNFSFNVCVIYDAILDAKRIDVTVTPPSPASPVSLSAYRFNY